ncbi:FHA domain-containing protein [Prosthecobacter sp. SYSU 5D2]|uniref:FHA domain-containing protein n=1 Tax=Prosthecobacter sp. SYSU 5D2 TaxID=3134134 RepID=UPI0031FEE9FE
MPRLKILHPDLEATEYDIGDRKHVSIGRDTDNHIILEHEKVSRHHAEIRLNKSNWWLSDLGSTNGTFCQQKPVSRQCLQNDDSFQVADFQFTLAIAAPVPAAPPKTAVPTPHSTPAASPEVIPEKPAPPPPAAQVAPAPKGRLIWVLGTAALVIMVVTVFVRQPQPPQYSPALPAPLFPQVTLAAAAANVSSPLSAARPPPATVTAAATVAPPHPEAQPPEDILYPPRPSLEVSGPVVSPDLRQVLCFARRDAGATSLTDVYLGDKVVRTVLQVAGESALHFSEDSSAWLIQAQDVDGRQALLLPDRTHGLEGELQHWLGSRDFSTLAYITRASDEDRLYLNDRHITSYPHITSLRLCAEGRHWAYIAVKSPHSDPDAPPPGERVVTEQGPGAIYDHLSHLTLSQNGKRVACVARFRSGSQQLIVNDRPVDIRSQEGGEILQVALAPDGSRFACLIRSLDGAATLHVEGQPPLPLDLAPGSTEGAPASLPLLNRTASAQLLFSPDSRHVAVAYSAAGTATVYLDDRRLGTYPGVQTDSLLFSPDGTRLAFISQHPLHALAENSDGMQIQSYSAILRINDEALQTIPALWTRRQPLASLSLGGYTQIQFSPDSASLACLASEYDPKKGPQPKRLHVNGKCPSTDTPAIQNLSWADEHTVMLTLQPSDTVKTLARKSIRVAKQP